MGWSKTLMLKRDDPVWAELVEDIKSVVSDRYAEDAAALFGSSYMPSKDEPLDEKPQEKWLEGVFDEAVLEKDRIAGFKAMVEDLKNSPTRSLYEETNGELNAWDDLSTTAKLQYIARDAAIADVGFEPFTRVVLDTIGDAGEAALRVLLDSAKELHAIAKLFRDDERTESTPLVVQVKELLDHVSALETLEKDRQQNRESLAEGSNEVVDGKRPQGLLEGAKAFHDMPRESPPVREQLISQHDEDPHRDALTMGTDQPPAKAEAEKLSLHDLRQASQEREKQAESQRTKPREKER
jgi:hypothetical protein